LIADKSSKYNIEKKGDSLIFSTEKYQVENSSVLHSGIFNKEFASMLSSAAFAGALYVILVMNYGNSGPIYLVTAILFLAGFPLFRKFIFRERKMETLFDLSSGIVKIALKGRDKIKESFPVKDISGMVIEKKMEKIVNRDGMAFVEKISLQHGAVIPGFGEEKILYILKLRLVDNTDRIIFADSSMDDVMAVHGELKEFLKI